MAKNAVTDWDIVPANNSDINGTNIAEGCAAGGINDAIRALMAQIAAWLIAASGPVLKVAGLIANTQQVADGAGTARGIGYRSLPTSRSVSAAAIIALTDEGQIIKSTTGGLTVPNNSTVACPVDFGAGFYNNSNSAQTIGVAASVVLRLEGSTSTVTSVSVPARTRAFLWQVAANEWIVSGKNVA